MLEKYLHLLDRLKEKQLSRVVHQIRQKIIITLTSEQFSHRIHPFLVNINDDTTGIEPFTRFLNDPEQVIQVKQIINALYYTEQALHDAETVNLRGSDIRTVKDKLDGLIRLYNRTISHTYQAGYLFTHLDFDFWGIFSQELAQLTPLITQLNRYINTYEEDTRQIISQIQAPKLAHQLGFIAGIIIDQMNPDSGEPDYEFLTRFSAVLPSYLEKLTNSIEQLSTTITTREPSIHGPELDKLQDHALQILNALEDTQSSGMFLPLKTLHYIHLIRHTLTLSMKIFDQIGHLNQSSQETIQTQLRTLKFHLLPTLFGFADKIEEQTILTPGTLTNPLLTNMARFYQVLIGYVAKFVDFSHHGQDLLTLTDQKFTAARLTHTYQRMAQDKTSLLMIHLAKDTAKKFFSLLHKRAAENPRVVDLPPITKKLLADYYQHLQPFVVKFNVSYDHAVINNLTKSSQALKTNFWSSRLATTNDLLTLEKQLDEQFSKEIRSREFHLTLNNDLISSMTEHANNSTLALHDINQNVYQLDETHILGTENTNLQFRITDGINQLININLLNKDQTIKLYQYYEENLLKLNRAKQAFNAFHQLLNPIRNFAAHTTKLKNLYAMFQPYLASNLSTPRTAFANDTATLSTERLMMRDQAVIAALSTEPVQFEQLAQIFHTNYHWREEIRFHAAENQLLARQALLLSKIKTDRIEEVATKPLTTTFDPNRNHHVLKHKQYSAAISSIRRSITQLKTFLNRSVRNQLGEAPGLPFPELNDTHQLLSQSHQVLGIKRFLNALYHLEQLTICLETLHEQSTQTTFSYQIIQISGHLVNSYLLIQTLTEMPYFSKLAAQLKIQSQHLQILFLELRHHYNPDLPTLPNGRLPQSQGVIFYLLNAMTVLSQHIKALRSHEQINPETLNQLHQFSRKSASDIERILQKANSYFRLFLETPTMYRLFRDLKKKLQELTFTAHTAAFDHIGMINTKLFTHMLLEADLWEDNLCLIPGTITDPMKNILDAFYQGFLEPLALDSKLQIDLTTSYFPTRQRLIAAIERKEHTIQKQQDLKENQEKIHILSNALNLYQKKQTQSVSQQELNILLNNTIIHYQRALPILIKEKEHFEADLPLVSERQTQLDAQLNTHVEPHLSLTNIEELTKACLSYFQGINASYQHMLDTTEEKITFLNELLIIHPDLHSQYLNHYALACFNRKKTTLLSSIQIDLIELRQEYIDQLNTYLETMKEQILLAAKNDEENQIDKSISNLLQQKEQAFKNEHYRSYYQLELIKIAIKRLNKYVRQPNHLFENQRTLENKVSLLRILEDLIAPKSPATGQDLSVKDRLNNITTYLNNTKHTFKTIMCSHFRHDLLTFEWLQQLVVSLLELLHLYTPERKSCYQDIIQSIQPLPIDLNPPSRFSFFYRRNERSYHLLETNPVHELPSNTQPILA